MYSELGSYSHRGEGEETNNLSWIHIVWKALYLILTSQHTGVSLDPCQNSMAPAWAKQIYASQINLFKGVHKLKA